ncbi:dal80p-controlled protein [Tilletia horrida]|uniref:Dal80p-controlled protein n=1 Tax=Tilletia horrida TaxID=155126 RepID=A0AAN6JSM4_9BASI|nr:dal80p-controlled protein [Tilletia horrida]KAK0568332.1 dal80p-controlled protein [Tilletia horrida]
MSSSVSEPRILVVNPNSSTVITEALQRNLEPETGSGLRRPFEGVYLTGPASAPPSINNAIDAVNSAAATFTKIIEHEQRTEEESVAADAFLVCCFSNHPLAGMLRQQFPTKPCMHILEAAVLHAIPLCNRFGVITTGADAVPDIDRGVRDVLGANSYRYVGTLATGLGVVELQTGDRVKINAVLQDFSARLARMGADAIILGCAGMTGMEAIVRQGAQSALPAGKRVAVIDGAKAGVQLLSGLVSCQYFG